MFLTSSDVPDRRSDLRERDCWLSSIAVLWEPLTAQGRPSPSRPRRSYRVASAETVQLRMGRRRVVGASSRFRTGDVRTRGGEAAYRVSTGICCPETLTPNELADGPETAPGRD